MAADSTSVEQSLGTGLVHPHSLAVSPISTAPASPETPAVCEWDQGLALLLDVLSSDDERAYVEAIIVSAVTPTSSNIVSIGLAPTPQAAILKDFLISQAFSLAEPVDLQVTVIHVDQEAVASNFTEIKGVFEAHVQPKREQELSQSLDKLETNDSSRTSTDAKVSSPGLDSSIASPPQSLGSGAWAAGMSSVKRKYNEYEDGIPSVRREYHEYDAGVSSVKREHAEDKGGMPSVGRKYDEHQGGVPSAKREDNEHNDGMPSVKRHYYNLMGGTSPATTFDHAAQNDQSLSQALAFTRAHFSGLPMPEAISQAISSSLAETIFEMLHASTTDDPNGALREISQRQREHLHRVLTLSPVHAAAVLLDPDGLQFPTLVGNQERPKTLPAPPAVGE